MSAVKAYEGVRPIRRWDREPSEFWEAVTRIIAELRYDPRPQAGRWPEPAAPVRRTVTGIGFSSAVKDQLCQLVAQLPWLLPILEHRLARSREEGLRRIDHYRGIFEDACLLIDLEQFRVDEKADLETRAEQIDALSRAMLLKSELLLVIAQFDLLREPYRDRPAPDIRIRLKAVA
ncbi:hypothetical protein K8R04_00825 [Candidatus Uhrbacteria bacterium]|nr:hypothetical protein [Candidatus Uhrbacteria bacterium]